MIPRRMAQYCSLAARSTRSAAAIIAAAVEMLGHARNIARAPGHILPAKNEATKPVDLFLEPIKEPAEGTFQGAKPGRCDSLDTRRFEGS